jgi:hypothetical protein
MPSREHLRNIKVAVEVGHLDAEVGFTGSGKANTSSVRSRVQNMRLKLVDDQVRLEEKQAFLVLPSMSPDWLGLNQNNACGETFKSPFTTHASHRGAWR